MGAADIHEKKVTVLIFSDRIEGIITTIGSMIKSSPNSPISVILVGKQEPNEQAKEHFKNRIASFVTMTIEDAQADLVAQGLNPIWNWDTWHTSSDPTWANENTIHPAEWDNLHTHAHELNHLRFYIPYLSVVKEAEHVFFIDDDLLIRKDLSYVMDNVNVPDDAAMTCPCNIWIWNDDCHHFDFKSQHANIMEVPVLYGGRPECTSEDEKFCLPPDWDGYVNRSLPSLDTHPWDQTGELYFGWGDV